MSPAASVQDCTVHYVWYHTIQLDQDVGEREVKGSGSLWVTIIIITIIIFTIIIKLAHLLSSEHYCSLWVTHEQSWILIVAQTDLPHMVRLSCPAVQIASSLM